MKTPNNSFFNKTMFVLIIIFLHLIPFETLAQQSNCLSLDGSNDYIDLGTLNPTGNFSSGFTYEAWINFNNFNGNMRLLDMGNGSNSDNVMINTQNSAGHLNIGLYHGVISYGPVYVNNIFTTGTWYHVAVTINSSGNPQIYINGVLQAHGGTLSGKSPSNVSRTKCYVGKSNWSDPYLNAQIDEIRIWNVVRTGAEIRQHMYNPLSGSESGLILYYNCNQGNAGGDNTGLTTLIDNSINNHNATLIGFALNGTTSNWVDGHKNAMQLVYNVSGTNQPITLPLNGTVDVSVNWGDGNTETITTPQQKTHEYTSAGEYTVTITGTLTQFGEPSGYANAEKLTKVLSFGELGLTSLSGAFRGCSNLVEVPTHLPPTITDLSYAFSNSYFNGGGITSWNVSNVTTTNNLFNNNLYFNQDISSWNVTNVTTMESMLAGATSFDQDLSNWNIINVTSMSSMLDGIILSLNNYSNLLISWAAKNVKSDVNFGASLCKYRSNAQAARDYLTGTKNWTITDGGKIQNSVLSFDGIDDYGSIPHNANQNLTNDLTIEMWINPKNGNPAGQYNFVLCKGPGNAFSSTYVEYGIFYADNPNLVLVVQDNNWLWTNQMLTPNVWSHIAFTFHHVGNNNYDIKYYINGKLSQFWLITLTKTPLSHPIILGRHGNFDGRYFEGKLDELRLWNTALTQEQICKNLSNEILNPATIPNLIAYFDCNQTNGSVLPDSSSTGNNGTLFNAPTWISENPFQMPTIISSTEGYVSSVPVIPFDINFYTPVTGFAQSDIEVTNGTIQNFADLGNGLFHFEVIASSFELIQISVPSNACISTNFGYPNQSATYETKYFLPHGNVLAFDGADDYILTPVPSTINNHSFTIECWAKRNSTNTYDALFGQGRPSAGEGLFIGFLPNSNDIVFDFYSDQLLISPNIDQTQWHHYAFVFDKTTKARFLYIDGALEGSDISTNIFQTYGSSFFIGDYYEAENQNKKPIDGMMDEVRIWDRVLSQNEIITNLSNQLLGSETGLSAYYRFDQGDAGQNNINLPNELIDYSTNCLKGSLHNFELNGTSSNWVSTGNLEAPIVSTQGSVISSTYANIVGSIFSIGETDITERGFYYATSNCPTSVNFSVQETGVFSTTGDFAMEITNLTPGTTYYFRAYAKNSKGISYGEERFFTTIALSGDYTIDNSTSTNFPDGRNFQTFTDAVNALANSGIANKVTFLVKNGTYEEQISIPEITGTSEINTITFVAENIKAPVLTYQYSTENYVVQFDGCHHVTFDGISIVCGNNESSTYGKVINIKNGGSNCTFQNCLIQGIPNSINSTDFIFTCNSIFTNNLTIQNNQFEFGKHAISIQYGNQDNTKIINNHITGFVSTGITIQNINYPQITGNIIENISQGTESSIGIHAINTNGFSFNKNKISIQTNTYSYGIKVDLCNSIGYIFRIFNNFISVLNGGETYGLYLENSKNIEIYHNTSIINTMTNSYGTALIFNQTDNKIKNNILANFSGGYAIVSLSAFTDFISDHNCLYTNGIYLGKQNSTNITTLEQWQTNSGNSQDTNSISVIPPFESNTDMHINPYNSYNFANLGTNVGITEDIDGQIRNNPPDIGADEFDYQLNLNYGLVANYPFNSNTNDESGNDNHGYGIGVVLTDDRFNNTNSAYDFNGSTDYIIVSQSPSLNFGYSDNWNISAWINTNSNNYQAIYDKVSEIGDGTFSIKTLININGYLQLSVNKQGSNWINVTSPNQVPINTWTFVSFQKENNLLSIYVDGVIVQQEIITDPDISNSIVNNIDANIGRLRRDNTAYFDGKIDDIRIYNRALSDSEIWILYEINGLAFAGTDQQVCQDNTTLMAMNPQPHSGQWFNTGIGTGTFTEPMLYNTTVYGLSKGENQFEWIVNVDGKIYKDTVSVFSTQAFAGNDTSFYSNTIPITFLLQGNTPPSGATGYWISEDPSNNIQNVLSNITSVSIAERGKNRFIWTISNSFCQSSDTINLTARMTIQNKGGIADSIWNVPITWNPEIVPNSFDSVIIKNGTVIVRGFEGFFYSLRIATGGCLKVFGIEAKGPGKVRGAMASLEQDIEKKGGAASLIIKNGGIVTIEQDIEKHNSRPEARGRVWLASGGSITLDQDVEKNMSGAQLIIGRGTDILISKTNPAFSNPELKIGNGGTITIEQDIEKNKASQNRFTIGNGGTVTIEQDIEYSSPAIHVKSGSVHLDCAVEKKGQKGNDGPKLRMIGGSICIDQDVEKETNNGIYIKNGGIISLEQDIEKRNIISELITPTLIVKNGFLRLGDINGIQSGSCIIKAGYISFEQEMKKELSDVNLVVASGGIIQFVDSLNKGTNAYLEMGSNTSATFMHNAQLIAGELGIQTISIDDSASVIIQNQGVTITGNIAVEQVFKYHQNLISPSVQNIYPSVFNLATLNTWNEPNYNWNTIQQYLPLETTKGYKLTTNQIDTIHYIGEIISETQSTTLTNSGSDINLSGWNLIGNPFTSAIDFESFNLNGIENTLYLFDPETKNYNVYQQGGMYLNNGDRMIPMSKGFFLKTLQPTVNLTLGTGKFHKIKGLENLKPIEKNNGYGIMITANGINGNDQTYVAIDANSTALFESNKDAFKLIANVPQIYTISTDSIMLSINKLKIITDDVMTIPLYFQSPVSATYVLDFNKNLPTEIIYFHLFDKVTNKYTNLMNHDTYQFEYSTNQQPNRFNLIFNDQNIGIEDINSNQTKIILYASQKQIHIKTFENLNYKLELYSIAGIKILEKQITGSGVHTIETNFPEGVYLAKVSSNKAVYVGKIMLK